MPSQTISCLKQIARKQAHTVFLYCNTQRPSGNWPSTNRPSNFWVRLPVFSTATLSTRVAFSPLLSNGGEGLFSFSSSALHTWPHCHVGCQRQRATRQRPWQTNKNRFQKLCTMSFCSSTKLFIEINDWKKASQKCGFYRNLPEHKIWCKIQTSG